MQQGMNCLFCVLQEKIMQMNRYHMALTKPKIQLLLC